MKILAIETSCDETAIALVHASGGLRRPRFKVVKNLVASQIETHRPYGGVVPNLAKREHLKNLPILLRQIFRKVQSAKRTKSKKDDLRLALSDLPAIDTIAVTVGPGLEPCLWTGITFAKQMYADLRGRGRGLTRKKKLELVGVNHLEGHLYSNWLPQSKSHPERKRRIQKDSSPPKADQNDGNIEFPAIALLVSGGHTILLLMQSLTKWKKLGETRDDAAGEAFDKTARLLGLAYPGGPEISKEAELADQIQNSKISAEGGSASGGKIQNYNLKFKIKLPRPMLNSGNYEFSFSGLKTAVLYLVRELGPKLTKELRPFIAKEFQSAVVEVLVRKTIRAAQNFKAKSVLLCGGVAANRALRDNLQLTTNNFRLKFFVPDFEYNTDNAAMIAAAAYIGHLQKRKLRLIAQPNLNI